MKQLNLAQTAILKFIENKDLTTKTTRFNAKYGKYATALKQWVEGNPKWLQAKDSAYLTYKDDCIMVKWTDKSITIMNVTERKPIIFSRKQMEAEAHIVPRTMEYCVDAPTTYGDATMRHS